MGASSRVANPMHGDAVKPPRNPMNQAVVLGFSGGGKIQGKGTSTSDSIDAEIEGTGEPIKVSTGERVISAEQDAFLQKLATDLGFPGLEAMLEAGTGRPVGPSVKEGKPAAAYGSSEEELKSVNPMNQSVPAATPGVVRTGNSFSEAPPTPKAAAPTVAEPVKRSHGFASVPSEAEATQAAATRAAASAATAAADSAAAPPQKGFASVPQNPMTAGTQFNALPKPLNSGSIFRTPGLPQVPADPAAAIAAAPVQQAAVTATPAAPAPNQGQAALNQPSAAQETNIKAPDTPVNTGVTRKGNSFSGKNLTEDMSNPLNTMDLAGANASMAKANAIRQSILDENAGSRFDRGAQSGVIEDSGRVESQALMDKWGRESGATNAMQAAAANPKAAHAIAAIHGARTSGDASLNRDAVELATQGEANQTTRRGQDAHLQGVGMQTAATERGQDVTAATAANQLAGNPMDNLVKQTGVDVSNQTLKKLQSQDKMVTDIAAEQDPSRRRALMDTLLASQGKNPSEHRYLKVEGGEEIAPDGLTKIKRPSGVYDTISGKFIPMDGAAPAAEAQAPAADKRVVGQTYPTPKGPMIWRGNGWEAAKK